LLSENGSLFLNTPNLSSFSQLYRYIKRGKKRMDFFSTSNIDSLHLHGYNIDTLEKACNFSGLRITKQIPDCIYLPIVYKWKIFFPLQKMLGTQFPFLCENLCIECQRTDPIDMEKQIAFWKSRK
jgi:hypothetical protein